MKLDMLRMPRMGLPSAGTPVTATDEEGNALREVDTISAASTESVILYPEEATALLSTAEGTRFERPVCAIVTGAPAEAPDGDE